MKLKIKLLIIISCFLLFSCSNNDNNNQNQSYYVNEYSGVLIGSTGAFELSLSEDGCSAQLLFDGVTYYLTSSTPLSLGGTVTLTDGIVSIIVTDNNGTLEFEFSIPNHTVQAVVVLSDSSNPNRNYIGWTENINNGVTVYQTTFNLVLQNENHWAGIERIDLDINPDDPNHISQAGQINYPSGTYSETLTSITFYWSTGEEIFTLNKVSNTLYLFQNGTTTFETELTLVE